MKLDTINFELDPDKKDQLTRATLDKMLKAIKAMLVKDKKVRIVITAE
jgi:hypothetical protein